MAYNKELFGVIFFIHLLFNLLVLVSAFLFSWGVILLYFILMHIQFMVLGNCFLNKLQFKKKEEVSFFYPYLKRLGFNVDKKKLEISIRYILPGIIFIFSIFWQIVLNKSPLIF